MTIERVIADMEEEDALDEVRRVVREQAGAPAHLEAMVQALK